VYAIRRAGPEDACDLLGLHREFCDLDGHDYDGNRVRRALAPLLSGDHVGQVWLTIGGAPPAAAGYAVVTWGWSLESGGREALLDEIYIRARGQGLGRLLLSHAITAAARAGASRMFLETEAHNTRARGFYARSGFQAEDSSWMSRDLSRDGRR
jgi:GNAT superfamily N-acetyltransferase